MKKVRRDFYVTGVLFLLFAVLAVLVMTVDVKPIGRRILMMDWRRSTSLCLNGLE